MVDCFHFPKLKFCQENGLFEQIRHIRSEVKEVEAAFESESIERVVEKVADVITSGMTALHIAERQFGINPLDVLLRVQEKNRIRGYEL